MPTSISHGATYIEPERHDELSAGVPDPKQVNAGQDRRGLTGQFIPGAITIPRMGGKARKGRTKLTHDVPSALPVSDTLKRRARFARRKTCSELARTVGGGHCGLIASLLVKLGVEDIALREAALAEGNVPLAKALGESARMHLLYSRELCAKDAKNQPPDPNKLRRGEIWVDDDGKPIREST